MTPSNIDTLLHKKLTGELSSAEAQLVEDWLEADEKHRAQFQQVAELWQLSADIDFTADAGTDEDWTELSRQITLPAATAQPSGRLVRLMTWQKAVAAVLLVGLLGIALLYLTGNLGGPAIAKTYEVPHGTTQQVTLPDGTTVMLNAGSRLDLYEEFDAGQRAVALEGEGFFEVVPDPDRPFVVHNTHTRVQVLGTAFNLRAYPTSQQVVLQVTEGSVQFTAEASAAQLTVAANEAAAFESATSQLISIPFRADATAWRTGKLVFRNTPFSEVLRTLERHYDVTIENSNTAIADLPYTSSFDQLPLQDVMEVLQETFDFQWSENEKRLRIN